KLTEKCGRLKTRSNLRLGHTDHLMGQLHRGENQIQVLREVIEDLTSSCDILEGNVEPHCPFLILHHLLSLLGKESRSFVRRWLLGTPDLTISARTLENHSPQVSLC